MRDNVVSIRLTKTEDEQLRAMADRLGMDLSTYVRRLIASALRPQVPVMERGYSITAPKTDVIWNTTGGDGWTLTVDMGRAA